MFSAEQASKGKDFFLFLQLFLESEKKLDIINLKERVSVLFLKNYNAKTAPKRELFLR